MPGLCPRGVSAWRPLRGEEGSMRGLRERPELLDEHRPARLLLGQHGQPNTDKEKTTDEIRH